VNVKLVSKWQGHQDGGKLILDTYSHVLPTMQKRAAETMGRILGIRPPKQANG
jgi:hypothetical protein